MDNHGMETFPPAQMVRCLRLPLGLHRHDPSDRLQLGWANDMPFLPRRSRSHVRPWRPALPELLLSS